MESKINPQEEAQNILFDILEERDREEISLMTMEEAIETVKCYGHEGDLLNEIAEHLFLLSSCI
jgi:hypothetical protein